MNKEIKIFIMYDTPTLPLPPKCADAKIGTQRLNDNIFRKRKVILFSFRLAHED